MQEWGTSVAPLRVLLGAHGAPLWLHLWSDAAGEDDSIFPRIRTLRRYAALL